MGRVRHEKWEARKIDIDILLFNDEVIDEEDLSIPHPHMANRRFVLKPLADIAPNVVHPVYNKTIIELLEKCPDTLEVTRFK
jgi:2-amino-4-hydroxy-6-hydroxymethyldihydropteridine diphosphokinase